MASSALLYIAWPLTLGLSFFAGNMILSKRPTVENSKDGNQPAKFSRTKSSSNSSTTINPRIINRRSSAKRPHTAKDGYTESYDINDIAAINDPQKRLTKLLAMINQLGHGDFRQVLIAFVKFGKKRERIDEYRLLLDAWAKINPEGALAYAKKGTRSPLASTTILTTWARYAPDAAIQWAKLNHKDDKYYSYFVGIIKGIASTNPERATDLLQELSDSTGRNDALRTILPHITKLGTEKASSWLDTIKDKKLRASATKSLAYTLALQDPQATAVWLETLSPKNLIASTGNVANAWAQQDIDKATQWTGSLEGQIRIDAAQNVMPHFITSDPNKAAAWMRTMSGESRYNNLVQTFILSARDNHPKIALANLDQLARDDLRDYYKHKIILGWSANDKDAATQWMQSNNIDAAAQKIILTTPPKWRR